MCTIVVLGFTAWLWDGLSPQDLVFAAMAMAATLLACWPVVAAREGADAPLLSAPGRAHACVAATATATGVVLAAHYLDVPLRVDEASTIAVAAQPLSVALTSYDQPNNHLLHTLLLWVAHQVGGWNRVVLRLPAFLSFCLFLPALWWFVRLEYSATAAAFTTALVAPSPIFIGFATSVRGYTLWMLLFVTALLCGRAVARSPDKTVLWATWAAAVALGCYTIPVMVFPAATTAAWMLLVHWRVRGGEGFRSFALRTVAWSLVALGGTVALYLPVALAERAAGLIEMLQVINGHLEMSPLRVVAHPVVWWRHWHHTVPAWAQGVLLGLVVVGAAVRGRSCGRRGTLLWATALGWVFMLAAYPILKHSRYAMWVLLVCRIMAGAGLAVVLTRVLARARARWPSVATAPPSLLEGVAGAVVVGFLSWWTIQPWAVTRSTEHMRAREVVPAMASAVVELMRPGDYISICSGFSPRMALYVAERHAVDPDVGQYRPTASHQMDVHRVSASRSLADSASASSRSGAGRSTGRLFLFHLVNARGESVCARTPPAGGLLEARWPDHQLVASIGLGVPSGTGRVYVLHDWAPG